jgi:nanoRNase/pAp phosphatase (c-di-AMP/oligoRNAs hydrolase)
VQERTQRYFAQQQDFVDMIRRHAELHDNVLVVDLRTEEEIFTGNRFTMYSMYPESNVSIQVIWGLKKQNVVLTVGYSILNRTCTADIGKLMFQYGGGGHRQVGTCQVPTEKAETVIAEVIKALRG